MYGLPKQTKEDIQKDIEVLQTLNLQHVSYYSLILEEGTILKYKNYQPLDEENEYQLTLFIDQELEKIGFEKYEISNYAKQGYQSKHNLMYWYYNYYYGIGWIHDEDSVYTMILPDNEAWDKAYEQVSPYFKVYNADEAVADSITKVQTVQAIVYGLTFGGRITDPGSADTMVTVTGYV